MNDRQITVEAIAWNPYVVPCEPVPGGNRPNGGRIVRWIVSLAPGRLAEFTSMSTGKLEPFCVVPSMVLLAWRYADVVQQEFSVDVAREKVPA